ncbi:MAG: alpha/beta hydrolase [Clostridia bacterium]|nr:alpha/beta hydrolase [Clostridia bacterium]
MDTLICGLKTEYLISGEGEIPVVLLHGWGSSFDVYKGIMSELGDRATFYAVNFPGCGGSEVMKTPWNIENYCDFVTEFLSFAGVDVGKAVFIGHSHGGRVILSLAGSGRISPSKIVLLDSAGIVAEKTPRQKRRAKNFKRIKRVLTLPVIKNFSGGLLDKARKHYGSADYNAAPPVLRNTMVSLVNTDLRDILGNIKCPTLLIWGEKDTDTPLSSAEIIKEKIADSGLCVIEGAGHFSFIEKPYTAHRILQSFIK